MRLPRVFASAAVVLLAHPGLAVADAPPAAAAPATVWLLDQTAAIGGRGVTVLGDPHVVTDAAGAAVRFDGVADGLLVPANPLEGIQAFTVEICFKPAEGGSPEQRFLHVQDLAGARALIEIRLDGMGHWWLDTFLRQQDPGRALIDPKQTHPTDRWYWAALRYDGKTMSHYVNGELEREGAVDFGPMGPGQVSLGVRQNKLYWFKGSIREVVFHAEAVAPEKLRRMGSVAAQDR